MREIQFGDPPTTTRSGNFDWDSVAEQLRAKPGEWALVFEDGRYTLVTSMSGGSVSAFRIKPSVMERDPRFEYMTTNNHWGDDGRRRCDLWMRYVDPKRKVKK